MFWKFCIAIGAAAALMLVGWACRTPSTSASITHVSADAGTTSIRTYDSRPGRERPVVAVLAHHEGAELTDFVVPHGILAASGVAEVVAVSTAPGPVELFPALTVEPDQTTDAFDRRYPGGADYVVVPAVHYPDDPVLLGWIREQAARGATVVGVCDGVLVLAHAGLLEGRRATAHWYSLGRLARKHPETDWVRNRRFVADGRVVTTTGVSASIPVSLALVEAIGGSRRAREVADSLGVRDWSARHESDAYGVRAGYVLTLLRNAAAVWNRESVELRLEPEMNAVTLALTADLWGRTYRSRVLSTSSSGSSVRAAGGLRFVPDEARGDAGKPDRWIDPPGAAHAGTAIDSTLHHISRAYGRRTAALVALQIEHPWTPAE